MKKNSYLTRFGLVLIAMTLTACGSGGGGVPSTTTLGITSISPSNITTKPSLASNFIGKAVDFFSTREAVAQAAPECPPTTFAESFTLDDGTIWVTQVYAVFDEIHFEDRRTSGDDDTADQLRSVVDLTGTDDNVPDSIPLNVPTGVSFDELHIQIKRLEDGADEQPKNVPNLAAFLTRIGFTANDRVRPSIYIEGVMAQGTAATAFTNCTAFKFVTDRRWKNIRIPFNTGTFSIDSEEPVLHVNIAGAFKTALEGSTVVTVAGLTAEVGDTTPEKNLGLGFLDGRLKDESKFGTPQARAVAKLMGGMVEVHTLPIGSFSSSGSRIDDSNPNHHHISDDDGIGSTDDNPHVEVEAETTG